MADIKLLDCTLRDGGYVNNWQWGFGSARRIIQTLTRAGVDIVEVGFLRNVDGYDPDVTVCNTIEELNRPAARRGPARPHDVLRHGDALQLRHCQAVPLRRPRH